MVIEAGGGGYDIVNTSVDYSLSNDVEQLNLGGTAALNGRGNALDNLMNGNNSANILKGLAGNDTLYGLDGADILVGGADRDTMYGGTGADIFRFIPGDFTASILPGNTDLIADFSHAQGDTIDLSGVDAISGGTDDAFTFLGTGTFTGAAGQLRYAYSGGNTMVYGDSNGDGVADFAFALTGTVALVSGDFVL